MNRRDVLKAAAAAAVTAACGRADKAKLPSAAAAGSSAVQAPNPRMPTVYIPHGAGPCFFMDWTWGPADTWNGLAAWLRTLPERLPVSPKAILVISAHWEESRPTVTTAAQPELLFDYSGFPQHTYALSWPAPGAPELAARVTTLLAANGLETGHNPTRGLDHGVFIPLLLPYPSPTIPTAQLSLVRGLNPTTHLAIGRALAPLRDEGVLIVGSGMSYHNMSALRRPGAEHLANSRGFLGWLKSLAAADPTTRTKALTRWVDAPHARECHPREEHLLPLMVCAGAAGDDPGRLAYDDVVMGVAVGAIEFG